MSVQDTMLRTSSHIPDKRISSLKNGNFAHNIILS